jgi:hypothetical protein
MDAAEPPAGHRFMTGTLEQLTPIPRVSSSLTRLILGLRRH